jgi:hypothetical protein
MKQQICLSRAVRAALLVTSLGLSLLGADEAVRVLGHQTLSVSGPMKGGDVWLEVTALGAKCNGSTDDTMAIQSAIDTVWTNGGIVLFPAETCVASNLIWRQGVVLRGAGTALQGNGRGTTLRQKANVAAGLALIQTDTKCSSTEYQHHSVIEWMRLQGDPTNVTSDGIDFNCRVGENTRFEHLTLGGFGGSGFVFRHGAVPLTMFDVHVFGSGADGIYITRGRSDNNQMVIMQMISGDDNGTSLIHINQSGDFDDFVINGVKCEKHQAGTENDCILLENMGGGAIAINGVGFTNTSSEVADAVVKINSAVEPRLTFTALAKQHNPTAIKYTVNDTISGLTTTSASGSVGDTLQFESNLVVDKALRVVGTLQIGNTAVNWTSAPGVPTGSCTTGSLRSRTDGRTGSTLYVCEAGAWTAK